MKTTKPSVNIILHSVIPQKTVIFIGSTMNTSKYSLLVL